MDVGEAVAPTAEVAFGDAVVAMLPTKGDERSPVPDEAGVSQLCPLCFSHSLMGSLAMELRV